jgi:hypothetical protein
MPSLRPISFARDALIRSLRFFYLLWGGLLLGTFSLFNRLQVPDFIWEWPRVAHAFSGSWVRGILLGIAISMLIAVLLEVWELVDRLLVRLMHDHDGEH